MNCPECNNAMELKDERSSRLREWYYEAKRNYECVQCDKRFSSLEIMISDSSVGSLFEAINSLYAITGDLHEAALALLGLVKRMQLGVRDKEGPAGPGVN